MSELKILDRETFCSEVEGLIEADYDIDYMDAITIKMDEYGIDEVDIPKLLTPNLKEKLRKEAKSKNLLQKETELPFDDD